MKRAKAEFSLTELNELLRVPPGLRIVALDAKLDPPGLAVYVEGDGLPELLDGALASDVQRRHEVGTRDGEPYASTTWEVEGAVFRR